MTEVIQTAASSAVFFVRSDASTSAGSCWCQLAAVEFTDARKRVAILSSVITHQVKLAVGKDAMTISVNTPDVGEAVEEVHCSFAHEPMDIGYNARYLLDILKTMPTDDVTFLLDRSDNAGMLLPVGEAKDLQYHCLLMPLRLND